MDKNKAPSDLALIQILERNFNLSLGGSELMNAQDFLQQLEVMLAERIKFWIRTDMDKLFQALYRIDVDDALSSLAFDLGEINQVSKKLAQLIIERQVKKIKKGANS